MKTIKLELSVKLLLGEATLKIMVVKWNEEICQNTEHTMKIK